MSQPGLLAQQSQLRPGETEQYRRAIFVNLVSNYFARHRSSS
jgi:hypothetical protein